MNLRSCYKSEMGQGGAVAEPARLSHKILFLSHSRRNVTFGGLLFACYVLKR